MLEPGHRFREQPPGSGRLRPARCLCLDLGGALYRWGYVWWSSRNLCTGGESHTVSSVTWAQRGGGLGARALPPPGRPPSRSPLLRTASWKAQLTQGHPTRAGIRVRLGRSIDEAGVYSTDGVVRTLPLTWPLLLPLVGNSSRGEGGRPGLSCHFTPRPLRELNRAHGSEMAPHCASFTGTASSRLFPRLSSAARRLRPLVDAPLAAGFLALGGLLPTCSCSGRTIG